ncbi:hypothetical protein [Marinicella litoralis]|nr:hypothetical protein [Marinicella litoralis]
MISITGVVKSFVTVGLGVDCDFNQLFEAYQSNELEVRVTNEQVYTNNFVMDKFKSFKGGYDSCMDAQADVLGSEKSKWSGLNANNNTVIEVAADLPIVATVIIENFEVYDGNNVSAGGAGGIKVSGNSNVIIRNSIVYDNRGVEGGGLHVYGADATLRLENTEVHSNQATGYGGGVYCSDGARLIIDSKSTINNNEATFNGGGIFGGQGCEITNASGELVGGRVYFGIIYNEANKGGGIYLQTGAQLNVTGTPDYPAQISINYAYEDQQPSGGGLYLTGVDSTAHLINTEVNFNGSINHGAGMVVTDQASLVMSQAATGCSYGEQYCSEMKSNTGYGLAAEGGAGYFSDGSNVQISQTDINSNRSNLVSGFVINDSAMLRLEGNLIRDNESNGNQSPATSLIHIGAANSQAAQLDFVYNTVVNNDVNNFFTANNIDNRQVLNVFNSIIWDNGTVFNFNGPATAQIDCSIVHETASLSGNVGVVLSNDPLFINAAAADFRPSLASDAIDFCANDLFPAQYHDLNNVLRGYDMASVNNAFGAYDAGAFEYAPDIIFRHGFD